MHHAPKTITDIVQSWPAPARLGFEHVRMTVFKVADRVEIGDITETLKWNQPSWLPAKPRLGTTLRCHWAPSSPTRLSLYVHCQTSLVEAMRTLHPDAFEYEGSRALHIDLKLPLPTEPIDHCAFLTLTYHRKTA